MVIGVSVSDFALLVKAAWKAYHRWNNAYGHYSSITVSLKDFCFHLEEVSRAVDEELYSLLSKREEYVLQWEALHGSCSEIVTRVRNLMTKHETGRTRQRNWKRFKLAIDARKLEELETDLRHQRMKLSSFVSTLTLPAIYSSINTMAAQMKRGNETVLSGWTTYTDDDPMQWRELRHTLHERYRHRRTALRQHKAAIMAYVTEANEKGEFKEDGTVPEKESVELAKPREDTATKGLTEGTVLSDEEHSELEPDKVEHENVPGEVRPNPKLSNPLTAETSAAGSKVRRSRSRHRFPTKPVTPTVSREKENKQIDRYDKTSSKSRKRNGKVAPLREKSLDSLAGLPDKLPGLWTRQTLVDLLEGRKTISLHRKPMHFWFKKHTPSKWDMLTSDSPNTLAAEIDKRYSSVSNSACSSGESSDGYDTSGYDTSSYDTSSYDSDSSSDASTSSDRNTITSASQKGHEAKSKVTHEVELLVHINRKNY